MPRVNRLRLLGLGALAALAGACALAAPIRADTPPPPRVTVIGDSVMTAIDWPGQPLDIMTQGFTVDIDAGRCRRVSGESCIYGDARVPTLIDVVAARCQTLAPTVVVELGYNDWGPGFGYEVNQALDALEACGVTHVLWPDLHEGANGWFVPMNAELHQVAQARSELLVLPWASVSAGHDDWFQDGIHLNYDGAVALATVIHQGLVTLFPPPPPPPPLVAGYAHLHATVGRPFSVTLKAAGGSGAYHWRAAARLPKGLHLAADGTLAGRPRQSGRFLVGFQVTDDGGQTSGVVLSLSVGRGLR